MKRKPAKTAKPTPPRRAPARRLPLGAERFSHLVLAAVLLVSAIGLWPDIAITRFDVNDNISHFTMLDSMVRTIEQGGNPIDFWAPEVAFGSAVFRTYQPLAHGLVALLYFAFVKAVPLITVFSVVRFLAMWLLPLSFFVTAGLLELPPLTRAAAVLLAPMISTVGGGLFGLEYRSYLWIGYGLFPQSVAAHLLLLSLGFGWQALRRGRHITLTGALLGLTCLAHFIYGYIGAVTLCLLALLPDREIARRPRILRTLRIGAVALVLSAFQLLPLVLDGPFLNHSRYEPPAKWDSYGAGYILSWLFMGRLFDFLRIPVLTLLIFSGVGMLAWRFRRQRHLAPVETFTLAGAAFWLLIYFGRSAWGPLLYLVGVTPDLHLHRVIAGVQIFAILLAAMALQALWRVLSARSLAIAAAITLLMLAPMVYERAFLFGDNEQQGRANLAAIQAEQSGIDAVLASAKEHGGRAYAGMVETWGKQFTVGALPVYTFFSTGHVPAVSFMYNNLALPSDIMMRFDETNPEHYRLFNVRTAVLPAGPAAPDFIKLRTQAGRFRVFDAPGTGYFEVVDVAAAVPTTRSSFFDINEHWMYSQWVSRRQYLWLELLGPAPPSMPGVAPDAALPAPPQRDQDPGAVQGEKENAGVFEARLSANRPAFALFRMTWHPNWKAYLDGKSVNTAMLSPGFIGVPMEAGPHRLVMRYEGSWWRLWMAAGGALMVLLAGWLERCSIGRGRFTAPISHGRSSTPPHPSEISAEALLPP